MKLPNRTSYTTTYSQHHVKVDLVASRAGAEEGEEGAKARKGGKGPIFLWVVVTGEGACARAEQDRGMT